jgi:hypothetical protein
LRPAAAWKQEKSEIMVLTYCLDLRLESTTKEVVCKCHFVSLPTPVVELKIRQARLEEMISIMQQRLVQLNAIQFQ